VAATIRNVTRLLAAAETVRSVQSRLIKAKAQLSSISALASVIVKNRSFFAIEQEISLSRIRREHRIGPVGVGSFTRISISLFERAV
jgi:hypothetical protein